MRSHSVKNGKKVCIICRCAKPPEDFYVSRYTTRQGKDGLRIEPRCKPCSRARRITYREKNADRDKASCRAYKASNSDKVSAQARAYRSENIDRVRMSRRASEAKRRGVAGGSSTREVRELFQRVLDEARVPGGWIDAYDGQVIDNPTIDHIVPISSGGQHEYENLCVTSLAHNSQKRTTPLLPWLIRLAHG